MLLKRPLGFTVLALLMPCVLLRLLTGCKTNQPIAAELQPIAPELQPLQGTWEGFMLDNEADGKITITITGNSLHFHRDTNFWFETTFTLPAGTDPQQLHATIKRSSPPEDSIGEVVFAIFKIEDGTLTFAGQQDSAAEPPNTFPTATGPGPLFRYDLKKVQPLKKSTLPPKSK
jgi:uncharacterized protein (TIGR03067 family)